MRVYMLCPEGQHIRTPVPDSVESVVCWVKGNDWYAARARAFQHALQTGAATIGITVNSAEYKWRPHWNGNDEQTTARQCNDYQQIAMWITAEQWVRKHGVGHVYVPPLAAMRGWPTMKKHPWEYSCNPVPPLVAVYKASALEALDGMLQGHVGAELCAQGYEAITLGDYFHYDLGKCPLDERGSMTTWRRNYERAIASYL